MQYIDGIDNFSYRDGIVRGDMVILQNNDNASDKNSVDSSALIPKFKTDLAGSVVMPLRAALQIHAALDELINKLEENQIIERSEGGIRKLGSK